MHVLQRVLGRFADRVGDDLSDRGIFGQRRQQRHTLGHREQHVPAARPRPRLTHTRPGRRHRILKPIGHLGLADLTVMGDAHLLLGELPIAGHQHDRRTSVTLAVVLAQPATMLVATHRGGLVVADRPGAHLGDPNHREPLPVRPASRAVACALTSADGG